MAEYEAFLRDLDELQEGRELALTLRELAPGRRKYRARHVRALLSSTPGALPDTLWVRSKTGVRLPQPWSMRIAQELPDRLPGEPYADVFAALGRLAQEM